MNPGGEVEQTRPARAIAAIVATVVFAVSTQGSAQDSPCTTQTLDSCISDEAADALAQELAAAREAAQRGAWREVIERLERAEQIAPLGVTRVAIARAWYELGDFETSRTLATPLLQDPDPDARALAEQLLQSLDRAELAGANETSSTLTETTALQNATVQGAISVDTDTQGSVMADDNAFVGEPPVTSRRTFTFPLVLSGAGVAALAPGIVYGLRSERLEQNARSYDRSQEGASIAEYDGLRRDAARAASTANALYIVSATMFGATFGVLIDREMYRVRERRRLR
jgi:hypothetical protein